MTSLSATNALPNTSSSTPVQSESESDPLVVSLSSFYRSMLSPTDDLFHNSSEEEQREDEQADQEEPDPHQETYEMILSIIERSIYFLATYDVNAQVSPRSLSPA
jgi:hypothetical protein